MDLYNSNRTVEIRYPTNSPGATGFDGQYLAQELAARLNDLVDGADPFYPYDPLDPHSKVKPGIPATDTEAIYVGSHADWAMEVVVPWWSDEIDFVIKVVSGADCLNQSPTFTGNELHIIARDYALALRAVWILLNHLGWNHCMPNGVTNLSGVDSLQDLWISIKPQTSISVDIDLVWAGAVDHLLSSVAGAPSRSTWTDGSLHPGGLQEGNLGGEFNPLIIESDPTIRGTWLRHMGWTSSSILQVNEAWSSLVNYDAEGSNPTLKVWSGTEGHYTAGTRKLYTDSELVRTAALNYANNKAQNIDWVSLSRTDGDAEWSIDFGQTNFTLDNKPPVTRQIELANHVATSPAYEGTGIVIQAYSLCAEPPDPNVLPAGKVCVTIMETQRPPKRKIEDIIEDYKDEAGSAVCPLGLYQYPLSAVWNLADVRSHPGNPQYLVDAVNRLRSLPVTRPKVFSGEAATEFGVYGLGYYCYMRMVLDIGRVSSDFTLSDFQRHATKFLSDMFPTPAVNTAIGNWYKLLQDRGHQPLLSAKLVRDLWLELEKAMQATTAGGSEEKEIKRVVELCKVTRFFDLRNRYEALEAAGLPSLDQYRDLMEWTFRIRDSGLVNSDVLFNESKSLNKTHHATLGLVDIFTPLNTPPIGWITTVPPVEEFTGPKPSWIKEGLRNNERIPITETSFSPNLIPLPYTYPNSPARQPFNKLVPHNTKGKMRLWLIPNSPTFECNYLGYASVEFINQKNKEVDSSFQVDTLDTGVEQYHVASLTADQLYEIQLSTHDKQESVILDWSSFPQSPYISLDPGRDGDTCCFGPGDRSFYFLVPDGVQHLDFYASASVTLTLFYLDSMGDEHPDPTFNPVKRMYQRHPVTGSGRRIYRIKIIRIVEENDPGFFGLNFPNLFAFDPKELLRPKNA